MDILRDKLTKSPNEKNKRWLREGHLMKETENLLISAQNNAIKMNPNQTKIDDTQQK